MITFKELLWFYRRATASYANDRNQLETDEQILIWQSGGGSNNDCKELVERVSCIQYYKKKQVAQQRKQQTRLKDNPQNGKKITARETHKQLQGINLQNTQAGHAAQYQKNKQPNQKMGGRPTQTFLQRRHINGAAAAAAAAAAAKSLQSCLTLWDPIDGSPPGSPVPGILQARTLEWVAISFSKAFIYPKINAR